MVASHWPVDEDAALLLSWKFYKEYLDDDTGREKATPVEALAAAQAWLRDVTYGELRETFSEAVDETGQFDYARLFTERSLKAPYHVTPPRHADDDPDAPLRRSRPLGRVLRHGGVAARTAQRVGPG